MVVVMLVVEKLEELFSCYYKGRQVIEQKLESQLDHNAESSSRQRWLIPRACGESNSKPIAPISHTETWNKLYIRHKESLNSMRKPLKANSNHHNSSWKNLHSIINRSVSIIPKYNLPMNFCTSNHLMCKWAHRWLSHVSYWNISIDIMDL